MLGKVQTVSADEISLFDISLPVHKPQRQNIMQGLNGFDIRNGFGTFKGADIGEAISAAVGVQLRDPNTENRKVIVLITAGNNQLSEDSRIKAMEAKKTADENGIEIYCVVLKDDTASRLLQELATKPANYQFASSPEDLVNVFRNFFADMIGSDPMESKPTILADGSYEIELDIPNSSVEEVNIIIPTKQLDGLTLSDKNGNQIVKQDDDLMINVNRNFVSYKFIKPNPEKYYLRYVSNDDQNVVVQYVFSYSVQVNAQVNASSINKNDPVTFTAQYTENRIPSTDTKLYKIPATLTLWKGEQLIDKKEMEVVGDKYQLTFPSLEQYGIGTYHATIHFEGDGMLRDSEEITFELINNPPRLIDTSKTGADFATIINQPKQADSYDVNKNSVEWKLTDFVEDINQDDLTAEIVSNTSDTNASCANMVLKVTPKKDTATKGEVRVVVHDKDGGASPELVFNINIENYEDRYDSYTARFDEIKGLDKNSTCDVVLRLYDANGNEVRGDNQLPETVEAVITPTVSKAFKCDLTAQGGAWVGKFATDNLSQDYSAAASINVGQKIIKAQNAVFSSANKAPVLKVGAKEMNTWEISINDPSDPESYKQKEKSWDLSKMVEDPNGDHVVFTIDKDSSIKTVEASVNKEDQTLTIVSKLNQEADGDVVVHSADNEGVTGPDLRFHVTIVSREEKYKLYTATMDADGKGKSRDTTITLAVFDENGLLVTGDSNLPNQFDASVTLNNEPKPLTMVRGEDGKWTGQFKTTDKKVVYNISAAVRVSDNISIIPPELELSTENQTPVVTKQINGTGLIPETFSIEPFLIWNKETGDIVIDDLNQYFADKDLDKLTFSIEESTLGDFAEAIISDSKLTIRGKAETSGTVGFKIRATDNEKQFDTSETIQFQVKSLKKQGLLIIALVVAALIALFILYLLMKPAFHNQYFDVSIRQKDGGELPQNKSVSMKGKKAVKLSAFTTSSAKQACGNDIPTSALNSIILKPGYSNRVKVELKGNIPAEVLVGTTKLSPKKGGTISPNGTLSVQNNGLTLQYKLKTAGTAVTSAPGTNKPTAPGSGTGTATKPTTMQRSGRT